MSSIEASEQRVEELTAEIKEMINSLILIRNCLAMNDLDGIARVLRRYNIPSKLPEKK